MAKPVFRRVRIDQLVLPERRIRTERRKLEELAASIAEIGVLVPLVVRDVGREKFAVIAGEGRLEAVQLSGATGETTVPVVVVDADDGEATLLSLVENLVREDMRPFDEADTARVLVKEYHYTQERVARALGKTGATVSYWLAVFELDTRVVAALRSGAIGMRSARALLPLRGDKAAQRTLLTRMQREGLSAGQVAAIVAARGRPGAIAPIRYAVKGVGRVDVKTTRGGALRVVLEGADGAALTKLFGSLRKRLRGLCGEM